MRVPPASLPASGSVRPNPPSARPAQRSGSQRSCCSGVPNFWIGLAPRPDAGLQGDRHRLVGPGDLLDGDAQPGEVAAAAVGLGERDPEQPELAHLQHRVDGERVVAVPRLGVRLDLGDDELAHHRPQRLVLVGQFGLHVALPAPLGRQA